MLTRRKQLEHRIHARHGCEALGRCTRLNCKITLHREPETVEVSLEDFRLFLISKFPHPERLALSAFLERYLPLSASIPHPLSLSTGCNKKQPALVVEDIDWSGVGLSAFPASDLENVVVAHAEAQSYQPSKESIEKAFDRAGLEKLSCRFIHQLIVACPEEAGSSQDSCDSCVPYRHGQLPGIRVGPGASGNPRQNLTVPSRR